MSDDSSRGLLDHGTPHCTFFSHGRLRAAEKGLVPGASTTILPSDSPTRPRHAQHGESSSINIAVVHTEPSHVQHGESSSASIAGVHSVLPMGLGQEPCGAPLMDRDASWSASGSMPRAPLSPPITQRREDHVQDGMIEGISSHPKAAPSHGGEGLPCLPSTLGRGVVSMPDKASALTNLLYIGPDDDLTRYGFVKVDSRCTW